MPLNHVKTKVKRNQDNNDKYSKMLMVGDCHGLNIHFPLADVCIHSQRPDVTLVSEGDRSLPSIACLLLSISCSQIGGC